MRGGKVSAQLKVEDDGEAVLRLHDSNGDIRLKLGAGRDGSALLLLDGSTEPGVHMLATSADTRLTLSNGNGRHRVIAP